LKSLSCLKRRQNSDTIYSNNNLLHLSQKLFLMLKDNICCLYTNYNSGQKKKLLLDCNNMEEEILKIKGGYKIQGVVKASGSKNAGLGILAATILFKEKVVIDNIPDIQDFRDLFSLLRDMGMKITKIIDQKYLLILKT